MAEEELTVPLYLLTGFLDGGKTTLIADTLTLDQFNDGRRTIVLMCEDGEEEYDTDYLKDRNCTIIPVENQEDLNDEFLAKVDQQYEPGRVIIEYNGMWPMEILRQLKLPSTWELYQAIHMADGTTFDLYLTNMKSMIIDMVTEADLVIVNRCTEDMPLASWKRSMRAVNRMCVIAFEDAEGNELPVEEIMPYSLDEPHIDLDDDDYGIFYLDIQEHPERYTGKTITMTVLCMVDPRFPKDLFLPGRNAMTCCEADIRFFGLPCKYSNRKNLRHGQWIRLTAEIHWGKSELYDDGEKGIVLFAKKVEPGTRPEDPRAYFR